MEQLLGALLGIFFGVFGALVVIVAWATGGIIRTNMLGCLGPFLTFVFIELPIWCGMPFFILGTLWPLVRNVTGIEFLVGTFAISMIVLIGQNRVVTVRSYIETKILRR